jgi:hypothetical protein
MSPAPAIACRSPSGGISGMENNGSREAKTRPEVYKVWCERGDAPERITTVGAL